MVLLSSPSLLTLPVSLSHRQCTHLLPLCKKVDAEFDIIVATTKLVNGKRFIEGFSGHAFPVPNENEVVPLQDELGLDIDNDDVLPRDSPFTPSARDADHYRLEQAQVGLPHLLWR